MLKCALPINLIDWYYYEKNRENKIVTLWEQSSQLFLVSINCKDFLRPVNRKWSRWWAAATASPAVSSWTTRGSFPLPSTGDWRCGTSRTDAGGRRAETIQTFIYSYYFMWLKLWVISCCCRTALIDGHTNTITASDITPDRKHLATVSLDLTLRVGLLFV